MNLLQRIVTPAFITFMAHCWFAYAVVHTFDPKWSIVAMLVGAGVKEWYVDKHYELNQNSTDNTHDFIGYLAGILLALLARYVIA